MTVTATRIRFARLDKSRRLQRVYNLLRERGRCGATTLEISTICDTVCAGTCVAELRANGKAVTTVRERDGANGRRVFRYILLGEDGSHG